MSLTCLVKARVSGVSDLLLSLWCWVLSSDVNPLITFRTSRCIKVSSGVVVGATEEVHASDVGAVTVRGGGGGGDEGGEG